MSMIKKILEYCIHINTINAFALCSRSLKYTYSLSRVNLQEFCVFTSKSTWIEYGEGVIVVEITPEPGYYNVSSVKKKIFPKKTL